MYFIYLPMNVYCQRVIDTVTEVMPLVHWQSRVLSSRWGCTRSPLKPGAARIVGTVFLFPFFPSFSLYHVFSVWCCYYCFLSLTLFSPPPILSFLSFSLPSFLFIPNFLPLLFLTPRFVVPHHPFTSPTSTPSHSTNLSASSTTGLSLQFSKWMQYWREGLIMAHWQRCHFTFLLASQNSS